MVEMSPELDWNLNGPNFGNFWSIWAGFWCVFLFRFCMYEGCSNVERTMQVTVWLF